MRHKWGPEVETKLRAGEGFDTRYMKRECACATCGVVKVVQFMNYNYDATWYRHQNGSIVSGKRAPVCEGTQNAQ